MYRKSIAKTALSTVLTNTRSIAAMVALLVGVAGVCGHAQATDQSAAALKAAHTPAIAFTPNKNIYPAIEAAPADLQAALVKARHEHKRVILDFGGDWCGDCQVLDIYFHQSPNAELMAKYFIKVNVNIGHEDANIELAHKYGVPVHGVPALAVLDSQGKPLFAQDKEFSDMRYMQAQSVTDFLNKWKP